MASLHRLVLLTASFLGCVCTIGFAAPDQFPVGPDIPGSLSSTAADQGGAIPPVVGGDRVQKRLKGEKQKVDVPERLVP